MTILLGVELSGSEATLTLVDRQATVLEVLHERLATPASEWWTTHPDERYRAVVSLLESAMREGLLAGGVAGIGLAADPGIVLLSPELKAIAPRTMPWTEILGEGDRSCPRTVIRALAGEVGEPESTDSESGSDRPSYAPKIGAVLSTLDYLRFQLTGALATHTSFAWRTGLALSGERPDAWDTERILDLGFRLEAFPPIFEPSVRVGVVSPEIIERTGVPRGVWVHAGSDPVSAALGVAAEPRVGDSVVQLTKDGDSTRWAVREAPAEWEPGWLPSVFPGVWFQRETDAQPVDPRRGEWPSASDRVCLDFRFETELEEWPESAPPGVDLRVSGCAGDASPGVGVQAGLGIGWWRDRRVLSRKKLPSFPYAEWRENIRIQSEEIAREAAELEAARQEALAEARASDQNQTSAGPTTAGADEAEIE